MSCPLAKLEEVFSTQHGAVYQCSNRNCYWLDFAGSKTPFKVTDFLRFKKQVDSIDLSVMLSDASRRADYTILKHTNFGAPPLSKPPSRSIGTR